MHAAGNAEFWVLPSNLNLEEITSASLAGYRRFNVKPPAALLKGEQLLFEFHSKFVKTAPVPNRDEFTWVASRLVKHVVLRVVFTDRKPDVMEFVVLDNSGVLRRRREILSGDPLTGEYRKEIPSADLDGPQPDLTYALQWRYNS